MKRHWQYLLYVVRHKWYVFLECIKLGIWWRGILHDLSKFSPFEWFAYAKYFYLSDGKARGDAPEHIKLAFDTAWLLHIHRNPHHWQYWVLREDSGGKKALKMPKKYVYEMVCDWRGAGKAQGYGDNTVEWYERMKGNMLLHPETRTLVELLVHRVV